MFPVSNESLRRRSTNSWNNGRPQRLITVLWMTQLHNRCMRPFRNLIDGRKRDIPP
jgi:hypothetical protein